jgi:uncharacterized protein
MTSAEPVTRSRAPGRREPPYRLRRSRIHGSGVFATRPIKKGARIIEYIGERISHAEADRRHALKDADDNHTFLFTIDKNIVIDAGVGGNVARFINHSCDPNCEVIIEDGRIFVESIGAILPGDELAYDYNIGRSPDDPPEMEQIFGCRCGAATCRGTMLAPKKVAKKVAKKRAGVKAKRAKVATKGVTRAKAKKTSSAPRAR